MQNTPTPTRSATFAEECRRQSRLASQSDNDHDVMDLLEEAAQDIEGWTP